MRNKEIRKNDNKNYNQRAYSGNSVYGIPEYHLIEKPGYVNWIKK